jgi:protein arginine N-methyltransferase 1
MGYFLWFEGMFDSVLLAAKKWLKPNGMMFPDKASVFISACDYPDKFLDNKYF